jgi:methyl-accepting chemotaxis protein
VVATEVRKLAERSQTSAREITEVAAQSVKIADRSATLLIDLVPAIKKGAELVQEVAAASQEQASSVTQVNRATTQVDQVTQRTASASEELSSTAEELSAQAEALQQLMNFFKVDATSTHGYEWHGGKRNKRWQQKPAVGTAVPAKNGSPDRKRNGHSVPPGRDGSDHEYHPF